MYNDVKNDYYYISLIIVLAAETIAIFYKFPTGSFIKLLFNEYEFDTVFHLGALSEVKKCQPNPKLTFETNVMGTINILEAARIYGTKAVAVSSSDKAYGDGELPYKETNPLEGRATYEVSKSCTDCLT